MIQVNPRWMKVMFLGLFFTMGSFSATAGDTPHAMSKKLVVSPKLRQTMTLMEGQYLNLQLLTKSNGIDYDQIMKALDQMQSHAEKIRKINKEKFLDQPLVDLDAQIGSLKKYVNTQNPIKLRSGIDNLYSTCFHCHEAHAPKQN